MHKRYALHAMANVTFAPDEPPAGGPPAAPAVPAEPAAPPTPSEPAVPAAPAPAPAAPAEPAATIPPAEPAPPAAPPAVPERVVPAADGYTIPDGVSADIGKFANTNEFTQEQLDNSLGFFAQVKAAEAEAVQEDLRTQGAKQLADWGENKDRNLSLAKQALSRNDPDGTLTKVLNESGFGNHPAVLKFLYNLGETMREGGFIKSAVSTPAGAKTAAQTLYPNHPSKK